MLIDSDSISIALFVLSAILCVGAIWRGRKLDRVLTDDLQLKPPKIKGWIRIVSFLILVNGLMLFHYFPLGPILIGMVLFAATGTISGTSWPSTTRRNANVFTLFIGLATIAYGGYELSLSEWKSTVRGAPIRVDIILIGFLLYPGLERAYLVLQQAKASRAIE